MLDSDSNWPGLGTGNSSQENQLGAHVFLWAQKAMQLPLSSWSQLLKK